MATVQEYIRSVRIALNMNQTDEGLSGISDEETLELDALIGKNVEDGVNYVAKNAPISLILSGIIKESTSDENCKVFLTGATEGPRKNGSGEKLIGVFYPQYNIARMVSARFGNWDRPVVDFITPEDPMYDRLYSKYGVKGNFEYPMAAIAHRGDSDANSQPKTVVELFRIDATTSGKFEYIPTYIQNANAPNFRGTAFNLAVSYIAYLTALSLGDEGLAQRMLVKYNSIIGTTNQQV